MKNKKNLEPMFYNVKQTDIDHYIAQELNEQHQDYAKYVRGIKLFFEWIVKKN